MYHIRKADSNRLIIKLSGGRKKFNANFIVKTGVFCIIEIWQATKGLVCELPLVDSGYRGEIHAILSNVSSQTQHIPKGSRIGQLVITPVVVADFVTELGEQRGTGAFGSTGK